MLQSMRERTQGIIAWIIMALLIIPFALWGVQQYLGLNKTPLVASIDGVDITKEVLQERFLAQKQQLQILQNKIFKDDPQNDKLMKKVILEQMLDQQATINRLHDSGFRIGEKQLGEYISKMPQFQDPSGFSKAKYYNFINSQRMNVLSYEQNIRLNMMKSQLSDALRKSSFVTNSEKQYYATMKLQKRDIGYALIQADDFASEVKITEQEIQDYYADHTDEYVNPEQVKVEYVLLRQEDVLKQIKVSDADVKQAYEDKKSQYTTPEKRKIRHILIQVPVTAKPEQQQAAKKKIDDIYAQLKKGASFADLAKKYSGDTGSAAKGGDLGYVSRGMNANKAFEDTVFSLKKGQFSKPIKTDFGYQIVKVDDIKPEVVKPLKAVKADLEKEIKQSRGDARFRELTDKLFDEANNDLTDLTPMAKAVGVDLMHTELFSRETIPAELKYPEIEKLVFDKDFIADGYNSQVLEAGKNTLVVVRVSNHVLKSNKPLAEVKPLITAALVKNKSLLLAEDKARAFIKQLNSGMSLNTLAQDNKLVFKQSESVQRTGSEGLAPTVVSEAFSMPSPASDKPSYAWVQTQDGNIAVVALYAIDKQVDPTQVASLGAELAVNTQSTESLLATAHMKFTADIKRYPENL